VGPVLPFLILLAVLQALVMPRLELGPMLVRWRWIALSVGDLAAAAALILRFGALIAAFGLFSSITGTSELAHGTELLLSPLARLGFPSHEAAMVISIALRFVPLLAMEAEHIVKAQASRGADFGRGRGGPLARARRMLPIYVPLFLSALRRAESLALAMEARCYTGGAGRTAPAGFRMRWTDAAALLGVLAAAIGLVLADRFDPDRIIILALFGAGN
jgi:energy-coupling factor transport system permease protein